MVTDGPSDWANEVTLSLSNNLKSLGGSEFTFLVKVGDTQSSATPVGDANQVLDKALSDPNIEIVVSLGVITSNIASNRKPSKPLIASSVIAPADQGFPMTAEGTSGVANLHYLVTNVDLGAELQKFQQVTRAKHIAILVEGKIAKAVPSVASTIQQTTQSLEFKVTPVPIENGNLGSVVKMLPNDVDAVFALPLLSASRTERKALIDALNGLSVPTFSTMGRGDVVAGFLMGTSILPSPDHLARQLAIDIRDIALGRSAGDLKVSMDVRDRLVVNFETARSIGYAVPYTLVFEADAINVLPIGGRVVSLASAINESMERNLSVAIAIEDLRSAEDDTRIARSSLLPQLNAKANLDARDRDLVGTGPTRTASAGISFSQSLYSERNRSNLASFQHFEAAQEASLETTRLDIIQSTAQAYLNVLVTNTERKIQTDNLRLTRANLERARFRQEVGSGNRADVYRFETELGNALQSVSRAVNSYQQAAHSLNRLLHRPISELFQTSETGLDDPSIFGDDRLNLFVSSPDRVKVFAEFLTDKALDNAPELVSLDEQIRAQERLVLAAQRKRYVPDVDLVGGVDRTLDDKGAQFPTNFDEDWNVGIQLSIPIYQGSRISSEESQSQVALRRLHLLRQQTHDAIETDVRNSVSQASSSRLNIEFAERSASAAEKNLELVTDAYDRGQVGYIDLIDAQNSLLVTRLSAANATFTHLIDLMSLQRAIGFFDYNVSSDQEDAWFGELNEFAQHYRTRP